MNEFKIILRQDKTANGKAPIYFRLFKQGKPIYISSGLTIPHRFWNEAEGIVTKRFPSSKRINNELNARLDNLNHLLHEIARKNPNASRKAIRSLLVSDKNHHRFFQVADEYLEEILDGGEIGTYDDRKSKINKFSIL